MIVYKNASFFLYIFLSKAQSVAGRAAGGLGFAHENRIHWLCGQPSANRAGIRAAFSIISGLGFAHENRKNILQSQNVI